VNQPLLHVNNLEVVYHHTIQVLKGLSLSVPEGAIVALLGSNGAGKTTTLKAISGLLPMEDGEIVDGDVEFRGGSIAGKLPHRIAREGLFQVMEGRRIFEHLTVEENLECASYARTGGVDMGEELKKVFAYFPRLRERRRQLGGYMSGGEQQMLAIGRGLMTNPRLLLLDEPSLGLSPLFVRNIFEIIQEINRQGTTILLVAQTVFQSLRISHRAYVLETGRVVLSGTGAELLGNEHVKKAFLGA
jgi:branched-chain amino acid transport system ATP-binding protein